MATVMYVVRSTKKDKLVTMFARINIDSSNYFMLKSGFQVLSDAWSNKTQKFKPKFAETDEFTEQISREITNGLNDLRSHILNSIANFDKTISKEWLENIIHTFHNPIIQFEKSKMTLNKYIDEYIIGMESGARLNIDKKRYGKSTIKNYKGFQIQFKGYIKSKRRTFDFNDINLKFYDDFVAFFTKKNYSLNTIGRHVKELKIIMRAARDEGYHNNAEIESRKFRVLTTEVDNIYLNESELKAMYELDLSKDKPREQARDVFLVGCYTAQRYSDYSVISENNIRKLDNGQIVIDLKQQKTGNRVIVPARPELLAILEKYDNKLPRTYEQKVNKYIKEVAEKAGITEVVETEEMKDGHVVKNKTRKCDLVKTHTARRSGATNMYLAKIPAISIMKITGHKTEKEFMKYIRISEEQTAIDLMNHPYFN